MRLFLRVRWPVVILLLGVLLLVHLSARPLAALTSCAQELGDSNLLINGMMREGDLSPYGPVADSWTPFVMDGAAPHFEWVDNEAIDPNGSQYIWADAQTFDAGLYQVVPNLTPNEYYHAWIGYAQRRYDPGDTVNHSGDQIGAMIGVDPTGGTDPHSSNIQWSTELLSGSALNNSKVSLTVAAQSQQMTVFIRALNHEQQYRNKVWFDSICMEANPDLPTATPAATATPSLAPTQPRAPIAQAARPIVTKAATPVPTDTATEAPTEQPSATPTSTHTATVTATATETPRPRRAIPNAVVSTEGMSGTGSLPEIFFLGSAGAAGLGSLALGLAAAYFYLRSRRRGRSAFGPEKS